MLSCLTTFNAQIYRNGSANYEVIRKIIIKIKSILSSKGRHLETPKTVKKKKKNCRIPDKSKHETVEIPDKSKHEIALRCSRYHTMRLCQLTVGRLTVWRLKMACGQCTIKCNQDDNKITGISVYINFTVVRFKNAAWIVCIELHGRCLQILIRVHQTV